MVMKHIIYISVFAFAFLFLGSVRTMACTAAVISGKATPDGRPLLWKHRDTGMPDNALEHFKGERFSFTGLVNAGGNIAPGAAVSDREVWAGANTAGFAIINTASYNIKDDDIPPSMMDREGIVIHRALGICGTVSDFEHFLDTLSRPIGVEANFGVIDASGGAAMYEVNNGSYVKYDVNDSIVAPDGYIVFTNFSFSGRKEDVKGYERYLTASAVFGEAVSSGTVFTPDFIFGNLSRSFRNDFTGTDLGKDFDFLLSEGIFNGIVPDIDFIPRRSTSASVVVQGVESGEDPLHTVMWTVLGYPPCGTAVPVPVSVYDIVPDYMKFDPCSGHSLMCDIVLDIKYRYVFRFGTGSGKGYLDMSPLMAGGPDGPSILECCTESDRKIRETFLSLYNGYTGGRTTAEEFYSGYLDISPLFLEIYLDEFKYFAHLLKNH